MKALEGLVKWVGAVAAIAAFGIAAIGAVMAGVDPLWAILRAGGVSIVLLVIYSTLCKLVLPLAASLSGPYDSPDPEKH